MGNGSLKPIWWLESSSYPIKPLRCNDLEVLLASTEMGQKYDENLIAVKFPFGQGRIVHVTSHFYLQTAKSKYDAQAKKTGLDFATKFLGMAQDDASQIAGLNSIAFGALESAYTSMRFLYNIFLQKINQEQKSVELLASHDIKMLGTQHAVSLRKLPEGKKSTDLI